MIIAIVNLKRKRTGGACMVEKIKWRKRVGQLWVCLELQRGHEKERKG